MGRLRSNFRVDGYRIRREREARGWSRWDLSHRSTVREGTIRRIERGEREWLSGDTVWRLEEAFDLPRAALVVERREDRVWWPLVERKAASLVER